MKDKYKKYFRLGITLVCVVAASLLIAFAFQNAGSIGKFFRAIGNALEPVFYGALFAFLFSPVYNWLRRRNCRKWVATAITAVLFLVIFGLFCLSIVPALIDSISTIIKQMPKYIESIDAFTERMFEANPELGNKINTYYSGLGETISKWFSNQVVPNSKQYIADISAGIFSILITFKNLVIGYIVMIYLLNMKGVLKSQSKKVLYSIFKIGTVNHIIDECRYVQEVFLNFILGKILDSVIIGILTFIVVSIFRIPYAVLISIIVGATNIIPFFGPFIGAIPCALLLLVVSPVKCLIFVIIIIVIQQVDGNIIGPKILGVTTGVSSFWVLFSILLFGGLFGIGGMIIGVPCFAVIYRFIKERVYKGLEEKGLSTESLAYKHLDHIDKDTKEYVKKDDTV